MGKRKTIGDDKQPSKDKMDIDGEDSGSDDEVDMLDVDFEFMDPDPEVDFHGLKNLLRQLLDADNQLFDLSELADLILSQPGMGSTVKCDGKESDPYALLTALNLNHHRTKPVILNLTRYILSRAKASGNPDLQQLEKLLASDSKAQVALVLNERFINIPHQVIPPMYNLMLEEIDLAVKDKEPYNFTHYLILSRTYQEVDSKLDAEDERPSKKGKKAGDAETFYFHAEDEMWQKHSLGYSNFEYEKEADEGASDSKRVFAEAGIKPQGHMILIDGKKFQTAVKAVGDYLQG
ncbi:Putative BCP1 family protein [Septoria linicola]|uniref:Protein BCP1 n=1 Tax=Septoria linicola TaxID=215465 RepID=A0A9Q9AXN5_9PEZI|nr:Putative BCP1 family protein [Septoria linicola]